MGRAIFKHPLHYKPFSGHPTVRVHTGKIIKALLDSGAAISLACTSVYYMIEECYDTKILPAVVYLKTADGSLMASLGKLALHLCTAILNSHILSLFVTSYQKLILHLA